MKVGYSAGTQGAIALTAATARTILGVNGNAAFGLDLIGYRVAFDGVSGAAVGVYVELCYCTFATNPPGTNSSAVTINTIYGRQVASGMSAAAAWVAANEPTVVTPLDGWLLTPNAGLVIKDIPRDRSWDSAPSNGFSIRCTAPAGVNVRAEMFFERS